ncbi:MAG: hypothetical protein LBB77_09495, partial [Treponema sp.]|nr:hypothetical protein [Treponema sp.]
MSYTLFFSEFLLLIFCIIVGDTPAFLASDLIEIFSSSIFCKTNSDIKKSLYNIDLYHNIGGVVYKQPTGACPQYCITAGFFIVKEPHGARRHKPRGEKKPVLQTTRYRRLSAPPL